MKNIKLLAFCLFLFGSYTLQGQNKPNKVRMTKNEAKAALKVSLKDTTLHNVINKETNILTDEKIAIQFAELVLFEIYGQKTIEMQKPYDAFLINNHWLISGTITKGYKGGTFMIIIDARNYKIIRITHGK